MKDDTKAVMQRALEEAKARFARRGGRELAKEVRHTSLKKTVDAFMSDHPGDKKTAAVAYAKEGYRTHWRIKVDTRTIYEACKPSSRSDRARRRSKRRKKS